MPSWSPLRHRHFLKLIHCYSQRDKILKTGNFILDYPNFVFFFWFFFNSADQRNKKYRSFPCLVCRHAAATGTTLIEFVDDLFSIRLPSPYCNYFTRLIHACSGKHYSPHHVAPAPVRSGAVRATVGAGRGDSHRTCRK